MLSQHDRRVLAALEEQLGGEAPDLERALARFDRWAPARRRIRHRAAWCVVIIGAVLLGASFALHNADLLVVAVMALVCGAVYWRVSAVAGRRSRSGHRGL